MVSSCPSGPTRSACRPSAADRLITPSRAPIGALYIMGFSIPQGMTLEQVLLAMGQASEPEPEEKPARKRARDTSGRLQADDLATTDNEA